LNSLPQFRLDGKHILVTGASSGIGRAAARAITLAGGSVIASGRNADRLAETAAQFVRPADHVTVVADLTDDSDVGRLADTTGTIDGVVHAAGVKAPVPLRVATRKFIEERFNTNYVATALLTQRLLAKNRIANGGSILFMSSISAHTGTHGMAIYSATKAALIATAKCLALEVAKRSIRVNCVSPGVVRSPLWADADPNWLEAMEKRYPLGLGTPEDVANASVFFLSDASRWITGQTLIMDGACPWI
jgi:NAD(P)-dependent dehydrogenase (short-subunit alcohol dehydrogenase family)